MTTADDERLRRWRLVLGGADDGIGVPLNGLDARVDSALGALYDAQEDAAGEDGGPGSARRPPGWPAGSATSGRSSRSAWSR
jgi:hypothetical protein